MGETERGIVMVFTGNGKGKTTAAFGAALRAVGAGWKVLVIQFVKAPGKTGEATAAGRLAPDLRVVSAGKGFVREDGGPSLEEHAEAAREALDLCRGATDVDLLIMDEVNFAISKGLIAGKDVLDFLGARRPGMTVILTGRGAPQEIIDRADLVTEMREVKHPFHGGLKARKGIEY
jgi:cob(I)alamin adenosyltransferase